MLLSRKSYVFYSEDDIWNYYSLWSPFEHGYTYKYISCYIGYASRTWKSERMLIRRGNSRSVRKKTHTPYEKEKKNPFIFSHSYKASCTPFVVNAVYFFFLSRTPGIIWHYFYPPAVRVIHHALNLKGMKFTIIFTNIPFEMYKVKANCWRFFLFCATSDGLTLIFINS